MTDTTPKSYWPQSLDRRIEALERANRILRDAIDESLDEIRDGMRTRALVILQGALAEASSDESTPAP